MKFLSQRNQGNIFNHTILILLSLSIILPLAVLFFNSIKPQSEFGIRSFATFNKLLTSFSMNACDSKAAITCAP